jgi:predicted MFS family arabinose efflux permease
VPPTEADERAANALLRLLTVAIFVTSLDFRSVTPLLPAVAGDLDVSVAAAGLVVTAYGLPYAVCQLAYGPLGDRVGRLRVITWAYIVFVVGAFCSSLAPTLPFLALARVVAGGAAAAVFPMALAHIGDHMPYHRRQAAVGLLISTSSAAQVLSVSIGGMVGEFLSWRLLYAGFAVLGLAVWVLLFRALKASPPHQRPAVDEAFSSSGWRTVERLLAQYVSIYRKPYALRLFAMVFVENFFLIGGFSYIGASIHDRFNVGLLVVGFLLMGYGIGSISAAQAVGRVVHRLGESRLILAGGLLMGSGFLLAEVMPRAEFAFLAAGLMGAGFVCAHTTLQTRMTELAPSARGTALAMHAFHTTLGQAAGAAVFSVLLVSGGYDLVLLTSTVGLFLFGLIAAPLMPRLPSRSPA